MKIIKIYILILISTLLLSSCLRDDELNIPFQSITPLEIGDGTAVSSPEAENVNENELKKIYKSINEDENLWSIRSLLVYRNGKLIAENYLSLCGGDKDIVILIPWVAWSFISIFSGIFFWKRTPQFKTWVFKSFFYSVVVTFVVWLCLLLYSLATT